MLEMIDQALQPSGSFAEITVDIAVLMIDQADLYRPKAEAGSIEMKVLPVDVAWAIAPICTKSRPT